MNQTSIYARYWNAYGGLEAILRSGYFWFSFCVTIVCYRIWSVPGWWDSVLSILPNLLGFSLGGFALWLAIGDDKFRRLIAKRNNNQRYSSYAQINASFVHFIFLQVSALISALLAKGLNFKLPKDCWVIQNYSEIYYLLCGFGAFLGFLLFVYALMSALAATLGLFQITFMYEYYLNKNPEQPLPVKKCALEVDNVRASDKLVK